MPREDRDDRSSRRRGGYKGYTKRTADQVRKRAEQKGGLFDKYFKDAFKVFNPKEGTHEIRPLPATWDGAEHYGFDIWLHGSVGPDNQSYLCLDKMKGEECPICEVLAEAKRKGTDVQKKGPDKGKPLPWVQSIRAKKRVAMWIINRDEEREGPHLYAMPWTLDKEINALAINKKTGETDLVEDPEDGFDITFTREGSRRDTKYVGVKLSRDPCPLHDKEATADKWLDFVQENPIPDCLEYFDAEHIAKVFSAAPADEKEDEEDDDRSSRRSRRSRDDDDEDDKPKSRRSRDADDDEDEDDKPSRRSKRDDDDEDEDDRPSRRRASKDDDEDDDKPSRRSRKPIDDEDESIDDDPKDKPSRRRASKDDDDDEDEDDDKPRHTGKRRAAERDVEDEDDDKPARRTRRADPEEDEDAKPAKSRGRVRPTEDDEEEDKPSRKSKRGKDDDEDDDAKPSRKSRKSRDDDDEAESDDIPF